MKKLIFAAMAALCFSAQAKKTIISGRVENWEGVAGALVMNFCDPLGEEDRRAVELKKTGGTFRFEHDYACMQSVTMALGGQFVIFFVTPGGSIEMTIDARTGNAEFSGDGAKLSREINDWTHSTKLPMDVDREGDLRTALAANFAAAEALIDASGMSKEARRWALLEHKFGVANSFIGGGGSWELFTDPALFGDVWSEDNFITMMYPYHLMLLTQKLGVRGGVRELIPALRERVPEGMARDMELFFYAKGTMEYTGSALWNEVPELHTAFSDPLFAQRLEELSVSLNKVVPVAAGTVSDGVLYFNGTEIEGAGDVALLDFLHKKYAGKVIYIDVWATWCGPCQGQFSNTPPLHDYFEGKDVVFVNVCGQCELATWLPTMERWGVHGENYFLGEDATTMLLGEYNLPGFPSYMIIDRAGNLHNPAPRPSNLDGTIKKIEELL